MKKNLLFCILLLMSFILLIFFDIANAQDEKQSFSLTQKNDWLNPDSKPSYFSYTTVGYANWQNFGFWFDIKAEPEHDYLRFRPALVYGHGSFYLIAGISTDSQGSDYVQTGFWYIGTLRKVDLSLDTRNYWRTGGKASSYLENLFEAVYPVTKKVKVGISGGYSHWWEIKCEQLLIGPIVYYKATDWLTIFLRYAPYWTYEPDKTQRTETIRIGFKIIF